jgi:hypothetical protein
MKYQNRIALAQAPAGQPGYRTAGDPHHANANINPRTGLATDYLNHFNEAIMLLEMLSICPECLEDFMAWRPVNYRYHFAGSRFAGRDLAIAAYESAEPSLRESLDALTAAMTALLQATRAALQIGLPSEATCQLASRAVTCLKPLVARAGAVINGEVETDRTYPSVPQAMVDKLMERP